MSTINIALQKPKSEYSPITFIISDGRNNVYRISANISIKTKHFSKVNKCVTSANSDAVSINAFLKVRKALITKIFFDLKAKNIVPTAQLIKDAINELETPQIKPIEVIKPTIWNVWELFMNEKNTTENLYVKKYTTLKNHLIAFEDKQKIKLDLDTINASTFSQIEKFFFAKNYNVQTTAKYLSMVKSFLKWCVSSKKTTNDDYIHFAITSQADSLKVVITPAEIELIKATDLGTKTYLENVRELFVLSCLCGLRFSDYTRIAKEHLKYDNDNNPLLMIRQRKTQTFVEIPLTFESENLVKKLIDKEIHPISNQKMNKYLKELCQIAGINEIFEVQTTAGNKKTTTAYAKYDLVCSHTGRRTFATNLLSGGLSAIIVMKFTGHTDYKSFMKYVNIPKDVENDMVRTALNNIGKKTFMKIA